MRVSEKFTQLSGRKERALILFVTAGDQPLNELPDILSALQQGGADLVEVGVPFSDPFGEGPTIQNSSQRSLESGTTTEKVLAAIAKVQLDIPIITMGYYNPILKFGLEAYAGGLVACKATGAIISDLVPDESHEWLAAAQKHGIETIFLAAPTSTDERLAEVCDRSTGFIYAVSRTGVTGAGQEVPPEVTGLVERLRRRTSKPICVGFGVSTPEHVRMVCSVADGAVVGSSLVERLHQLWDGGAGRDDIVGYVQDLKAATKP